jgi:hypothetical protein
MLETLKRYGPVIASSLVFVVLAFREVIQDGAISLEDRYVLAIAFVNAVVTYVVPNIQGGIARVAKLLTHAALVALAFYLKAQTGDGQVSTTEWIDGAVLILGALGVAVTVGPVWNASHMAGTGPAAVRTTH